MRSWSPESPASSACTSRSGLPSARRRGGRASTTSTTTTTPRSSARGWRGCGRSRGSASSSSTSPTRAAGAPVRARSASTRVVHLAAQAGVRYSLKNPHAYVQRNLAGVLNVLEGCRHARRRAPGLRVQLSVYGANTKLPFSEHDSVDHPVSLYAATKKANELMAHTYSHLYGCRRRACASSRSTARGAGPTWPTACSPRAILDGRPIDVFNHGRMQRDFTYIDDIVEGVVRVLDRAREPQPASTARARSGARATRRIGSTTSATTSPCGLLDFIAALERAPGRTAQKELLPMQPGDVAATYADDRTCMRAASGSPPRRRSTRASRGSWRGCASITATGRP